MVGPSVGGEGGDYGFTPLPGAVSVGATTIGADSSRSGSVGMQLLSCIVPPCSGGLAAANAARSCHRRCHPPPTQCSLPRHRPGTVPPCPAWSRGSTSTLACSRLALGLPLPATVSLQAPTSSFFLVSTLITRSPAAK